jgi:uncharacterized protein YidB (DUF937 family)
MGLLDQILGNVLQPQQTGTGSPSSGIGGVLMNMLGGGGNRTAGTGGGLGGLLSSFEQAGLAHIAQSWIGNGPNQPVSPQQLQTFSATIRCRPWPTTPVWRLMIFCRSSASTSPAWSMA